MKVSIICTNYNKGDWVREAIDSFLNQKTNFDFEIIIIDDASTDHSYEIIQEYQNKFPEKVRTFRNEVNLGITKTWKKICREAKGQYIARCDSDDFWIDPLKLQKQVDLLDASIDSLWSNTEFDMVDLDGNLIQKNAFANKALPLIDSYEEMLVMKGMTMASTWLVDTALMQDVSAQISDTAADDTFELQLELFKRTKISFLSDSTTVYRMNLGSDSKPMTLETAEKRFTGILDSQIKYLNKYPDQDIQRISHLALVKDRDLDVLVFKKDRQIEDLDLRLNQVSRISHDQNEYIEVLKKESQEFQNKFNRLQILYDDLQNQYNSVVTSRRWTIPTKIINFFRRSK
ncbi:glycosyltransferase [Streptococcus cristatus]|jgi:polysaccharide biosynthesis protein/putative glycosyltransferase|uniref:Glycosyltransferase, group 2 family protein n=2 Tax=Streptococcus cristatus TaxID=45634 RepID=A0AAV3EC47_STRCR|nr:glycosyltransferase [Streptococcus cristatus]RKW08074.1 MAG: glycosyltransferase [Streptococcus sp.]EFX53387.1 glycosyltransferase, group 2 family protein [Streptococcus cristatus ATCC 51100]EGU66188.1 glycosyltransferase, group 2 family protein [Streptococcus cristatus ATCC 51100]KJQ57272.1 glycosyl transferase family protein [Streptococcus cristatus]MBZ2151116.1 glycosyltransferase [Streptococcus cristatus]